MKTAFLIHLVTGSFKIWLKKVDKEVDSEIPIRNFSQEMENFGSDLTLELIPCFHPFC